MGRGVALDIGGGRRRLTIRLLAQVTVSGVEERLTYIFEVVGNLDGERGPERLQGCLQPPSLLRTSGVMMLITSVHQSAFTSSQKQAHIPQINWVLTLGSLAMVGALKLDRALYRMALPANG